MPCFALALRTPLRSLCVVATSAALAAGCASSRSYEPDEPNRCGGVPAPTMLEPGACPAEPGLAMEAGCPANLQPAEEPPLASSEAETSPTENQEIEEPPTGQTLTPKAPIEGPPECAEPAGSIALDPMRPPGAEDRLLLQSAMDALRNEDVGAACPRIDELFRRVPTPTVAHLLARCERDAGHLLRAQALFRSIAVLDVGSSTRHLQAAVEEAGTAAAALEARLPTLTVRIAVEGTPPYDDVPIITVDSQRIAPALLAKGIQVDPGPRVVQAWVRCYEPARTEIILMEGESKTVAVSLRPLTR